MKSNIKLILLYLLCSIICMTESRYRDKERKREKSSSNRLYSSNGNGNGNNNGIASLQASTLSIPNLCSRERDQKLLCYCLPDNQQQIITTTTTNNNNNNNHYLQQHEQQQLQMTPPIIYTPSPATKADCWIFHKDFHSNDTIWNAFHQQKSLRDLKFTVQPTGQLDYIPTKYIELLTNLTILNIEYSQILVVKSYAFGNLQNLEIITLTNNQIEILDQNAFANHILLKELNLQNNQIIEIDRYAFRNLPQLSALYLNSNNITNLHEELFKELTKLEDLDLSNNQISVLTGDMFKGLGNLNTLKLTHNSLNFIGDTVFAELWSLQELELDDNQIERISERALDGLNNLKSLNLRNNHLKKLDNGLLRGTPALLSINLQENHLETLTYYNFQPIMDNLVNSTSELSVSANKLICDCRLQWLFDLKNRTKYHNLKNSLDEIECYLYDNNNKQQTKHHHHHHNTQTQQSRTGTGTGTGTGGIGMSGDELLTSGANSDEILMNVIRERNQNEQNYGKHLYNHRQQKSVTNQHSRHLSTTSTIGGQNVHNKQTLLSYPEFDTDSYYDDQSAGGNIPSGTNMGGSVSYQQQSQQHDDDINNNNNNNNGDTLLTGSYISGLDSSSSSSSSGSGSGSSKTRNNIQKMKKYGHLVQLFKLQPESLPCPEELSDPTELPLSRESIGFNIRSSNTGTLPSSSSSFGVLLLFAVCFITILLQNFS